MSPSPSSGDRPRPTVVVSSDSRIVLSASTSVTVGGGSSSVMESLREFRSADIVPVPADVGRTPCAFLADAETVTSLSGASVSLSTAAMVTAPVLSCEPAWIVSMSPVCVKSPERVGLTAAVDTSIVVSSLDGRLRRAVTVVSPPFSSIDTGVSIQVRHRRRVVVTDRQRQIRRRPLLMALRVDPPWPRPSHSCPAHPSRCPPSKCPPNPYSPSARPKSSAYHYR